MPHSARIKLGDDALDLRVSANPDRAGEYLGPMVSWSIVTKRVELADNFETNALGVIDTVATAATQPRASAEIMAAASEEVIQQPQTVAAASEEASMNVQTVAAS